jgi:DNA-binding winged helix-turn-helix (wHTH) protein/TolB-like protein/Flp pilus assembly protein TadD
MALTARQLYRFGPYRLDARDRLLYKNDELVALPPKVADTLLLLVTSGGHVLSKDEMIKQLWPDTFVEEGTLTQYISVLRKALGESGSWIENLPRRGYRFTAPVEEFPDEVAELRIEEHTRSRTVIEEETVTDQGRISRIPVFAIVLAALLIAAVSALIWTNRQEPARSFSSVAVLPFRTVSDSRDDYLADGITEALITRLTNLKDLRVVSYSRVRRFKGSSDEAAKIGRQLGVEAVIEGTVRVASGRLRVSVQGVDVKSGYTIWALNRFEAKPERLLDIEGQLAEAAAQRVRGQLTPSQRLLVTRSRATNAEAYDLVLRARAAGPETDVPMLERAVQLDPGFADAYGWLALAQIRNYWEWRGGPETLRKSISNANQALSKDPSSAIATRALVHIQHETGRPVEGLLMARRALENDPDDLDAIAAAATAYFRTGLYDRAIPLYDKALAGEPTSIEFRSQLGRMYLFLGQHKDGMEVISPLPLSQAGVFGMLLYLETGQVAKAVEIARTDPSRPPLGFAAYIRGFVLAAAGDNAGAKAIWTNAVRHGEALLAKSENQGRILDSMIYAKLGRREDALRNLQQSLAPDPQHPVTLFFAAQTRALLGLRREALDTLKAAVENGFYNLPMIVYHTRPGLSFHILREDPEFHAIRADLARRIDDLRARY